MANSSDASRLAYWDYRTDTIGKPPGRKLVHSPSLELILRPLSNEEIHYMRRNLHMYNPIIRYQYELGREAERISHTTSRRPGVAGLSEETSLQILAALSIRRKWKELEVWNPKWGITSGPLDLHAYPNTQNDWLCEKPKECEPRGFDSLPLKQQMASWPSQEEETEDERAIRLYLQKTGHWSETLKVQPSAFETPKKETMNDHEAMITSRPWFKWALEVAEEDVRQSRDPRLSPRTIAHTARTVVKDRWVRKGLWNHNWSKNGPRYSTEERSLGPAPWYMRELTDVPGWKWKHESPSPEPPDSDDMELTASEIDALEALPNLPSTPNHLDVFHALGAMNSFRDLSTLAAPASAQPMSKPLADIKGDREGNESDDSVETRIRRRANRIAAEMAAESADMSP